MAGQVQADFNAAGMKTFAPVESLVRFKVVPFKAHAGVIHIAVQMPPAVANRAPRRVFGEHRGHADLGLLAGPGQPSG